MKTMTLRSRVYERGEDLITQVFFEEQWIYPSSLEGWVLVSLADVSPVDTSGRSRPRTLVAIFREHFHA